MSSPRLFFVMLVLLGTPLVAEGNERRFTHTYESAVLNPGEVELEPWSTVRYLRRDYLLRFDERLEMEMGLTDRWQTALYLNFRAQSERRPIVAGQERGTSTTFRGISWENKVKLTDSLADAFGSALYLEGTLAPTEAGVEAKLIFDKRLPGWLVAANLVAEHEWDFGRVASTTRELKLELTAGASYLFSEHLGLGVEARATAAVEDASLTEPGVFAGPVISWSRAGAWVALHVAAQMASSEGVAQPDRSAHEQLSTRLLIGLHL